MSQEKDEIGKLLEEYQKQRNQREKQPVEDLEPPKRREGSIDFAKTPDNDKKPIKEKKPPLSKEEREKIRNAKKAKSQKFFKAVFNKKVLAVAIGIAVIIAGGFIGNSIYQASKVSYLIPYQAKYKNVDFPSGILEEYCDDYGKDPEIVGKIKIDDIDFSSYVYISNDSSKKPTAHPVAKGYTQKNYVVYLDSYELEEHYKNADAFNSSKGFIEYSNLLSNDRYKIIGAFYTNTKAEHDNGYIFPYNTTEEMTPKDANEYIDRVYARFLFKTSGMMTRQDTVLTISCPTDFHEGFRFVVVAILDNESQKPTATDNKRIQYPQIIFDEKNRENPFRFASKWYPEIVLKGQEETSLSKKSMEDYIK